MRKDDLELLLPGTKVIISGCEAREHGDNEGCLCELIGTTQTVGKKYSTPFVGTTSWHLAGSNKRVRLSEITPILAEEKPNDQHS